MLEWIISSAVLLAAVIAVRYALRGRLRPGVQYAMWAIVLVRLLVPVSFGSGAYSAGTAAAALEQTPAVQAVLTPSMDYDAAYSQVAREYAGRGLDVSELAPRQQQAMDREIRALQRPTAVQVLQWVWLGGMAAMALTLTGTNLRLYIRLRRSRRELTREGRMPVYVTEAVDTPCLFGLVRPAVYLTPEAAGDDVFRQPAFDMKLEALIPVLRGQIPLKAHAHRADDIFTAIRIADEFGVRLTLEHTTEGHLIADELAKTGLCMAVGPSLNFATKVEVRNKSWKTPGILSRAGCHVSIITDCTVIPQQYLPLCAGMAVKAGMDPFDALRAITIHPAEHIGIADRVGSLEAGKDADLVITEGSPFEVSTTVRRVLIGGKTVHAV